MVFRRSGNRVKVLAAVAGGAAVVALGAAGALTGGSSTEGPAVVSAPEMTMGDTATVQYSDTTIATSMAVPADKAPPPCGFSSGC